MCSAGHRFLYQEPARLFPNAVCRMDHNKTALPMSTPITRVNRHFPFSLARVRRRAVFVDHTASPPVAPTRFRVLSGLTGRIGSLLVCPRGFSATFFVMGARHLPEVSRREPFCGACRVIMKVPCMARHANVGYVPGWRRTAFAEPQPQPVETSRTSHDAPPSSRS